MFASAQPSFHIFASKNPEQILISFLTEILRRNKRQPCFSIQCSLRALSGVSSWCFWAALREAVLLLLFAFWLGRQRVREQTGCICASGGFKDSRLVALFVPCSLLGCSSPGHCQRHWQSYLAVSVHGLSCCPILLHYSYSQRAINHHHFCDCWLRVCFLLLHMFVFFYGVFTSVIMSPCIQRESCTRGTAAKCGSVLLV